MVKTIPRYNNTLSVSFGFWQHACRPPALAARIFAGCAVYTTALAIQTEVHSCLTTLLQYRVPVLWAGHHCVWAIWAKSCFALGKFGVCYTASMLRQRMLCVKRATSFKIAPFPFRTGLKLARLGIMQHSAPMTAHHVAGQRPSSQGRH